MHRSSPTAFTLIELLVVIGIIALLIAILLPTLSSAREAAGQVRTLANVRELQIGYRNYYQEHRGALPFGYTPPTVNGEPVVVDDPVSGHQFGFPVADRYPWRIAPYVGNVWDILHSHIEPPVRPTAADSPAQALAKAYAFSIDPSFGINAVYMGGHTGFAGFSGAGGDSPNVNRHVAFRDTEVDRSSEQIVFAETQTRNGPFTEADAGLHYVTPPQANGERWKVVNNDFVVTTGAITGIPKGRFGERTVASFLDGHAEAMLPGELTDMKRWAPRADSIDYDFIP